MDTMLAILFALMDAVLAIPHEHVDLCVEDEVLAYAPERPLAPICVHHEGDGARFFPSTV